MIDCWTLDDECGYGVDVVFFGECLSYWHVRFVKGCLNFLVG